MESVVMVGLVCERLVSENGSLVIGRGWCEMG